MKPKQLLTILAIIIYANGFAQTKLIAFKSHSGNMKNFSDAMGNNLFDDGTSNYGQAPERYVKTAKLDSVKFISDTVSVMFTSECTVDYYKRDTTLWKAGKDTVYNHPLFTKKHSLDSIKKVLKRDYYFRRTSHETKFIGYDNIKDSCAVDQNIIVPVSVKSDNNRQNPLNDQLPLLIGGIALISLFAALISNRYKRLTMQ